VLALVAGLENYSKHPLAGAVLDAARAAKLTLPRASEISERPGQGTDGRGGRAVRPDHQ
jgi:cation transport ATPase